MSGYNSKPSFKHLMLKPFCSSLNYTPQVEILRNAIYYIESLETLLSDNEREEGRDSSRCPKLLEDKMSDDDKIIR